MSSATRLPAIYIPHGGGPWPFVDSRFASRSEMEPLAQYLRGLVGALPARPKALLVVSAHWEEAVPTVMTASRPPLLFDYFGFPPETYQLQWPAPGAPDLAERVRGLLEKAGLRTGSDPARGFDHGTFIPLMVALPDADIPVLQMSLLANLDPRQHIALGRALAPLRGEGVLLVGSGSSYHNMRGFGRAESTAPSREFDDWLVDAVTQAPARREALLADWASAPAARQCHPREEHLLPLHVMAGAGDHDAATVPFRTEVACVRFSAVQFG